MHNGTIMQFFILIVVKNSLFSINTRQIYKVLEIFEITVVWQPKNAGHTSKNLSLFDKKQAQIELTNVWHSTLTGSWQKLVSSMSNFTASFRQTSGQAGARQFFRPKSGGAFNKEVADVELQDFKMTLNFLAKFIWIEKNKQF